MLVVGIIRGPHGLQGKFKVESTSGESEHYKHFIEVTLRKDGITKQVRLESVEGCVPNLLIKCAGIDSIEEAKKFSSWEILVPKAMACPLRRDEYYVDDLRHCALIYGGKDVHAAKDAPIVIGTITSVLEGGSGDLLEVTLSESFNPYEYVKPQDAAVKSNSPTRLIPFRKEFIGRVDIQKKTVELMHLWILE